MCIRDRSGLIAATFCRNHVADPVHPTRSASTVAGIEGVASSSCLTCCSNGSKLLTTGEREYSGGPTEATAFATVFLEILRSLAICAFDTPSLRCSLRINAQSSKVITFPSWVGAHFSSVTSAQFSTVIDNRRLVRRLSLHSGDGDGFPAACNRVGETTGGLPMMSVEATVVPQCRGGLAPAVSLIRRDERSCSELGGHPLVGCREWQCWGPG